MRGRHDQEVVARGVAVGSPIVCFDLVGTIIEPGGSIRYALDVAIRHGGFEPFSPEDVLIGMPLRDILRLRTSDADAIEEMVHVFRETHMNESWKLVHYHDGFPQLIQDVRDDGYRTAIVTTKGETEAQRLMEELDITDLWDTIVGDDDVRPLKPDPAPVIAACGRLGEHPRRACMIGDTSFDMDAGNAAGAYTIGVTWGTGSRAGMGAAPTAGKVLVDTAAELLAEIRRWGNKVLE